MQYAKIESDYFCGIDLHARTMYVCIMNKMGEILFRRSGHRTAVAARAQVVCVGWNHGVDLSRLHGGNDMVDMVWRKLRSSNLPEGPRAAFPSRSTATTDLTIDAIRGPWRRPIGNVTKPDRFFTVGVAS